MIRAAGRQFIPKRFIYYFDCPHTKQRNIAKAIADGKGVTVRDICKIADVGISTTQTTIMEMKRHRYIYICGWEKTNANGRAPKYAVGDKPDVPRPKPKRPATHGEQKARVVVHHTIAEKHAQYCNKLQKALVPVRDPQGQAEVNRQYLNWISEGVYG